MLFDVVRLLVLDFVYAWVVSWFARLSCGCLDVGFVVSLFWCLVFGGVFFVVFYFRYDWYFVCW